MKLEVGKRYVRRDGTVTPPLTLDNDGDFLDPETMMAFDNDDFGNLVFGSFMIRMESDLMQEYEE